MRSLLLILAGISIGFWVAWPGIFVPKNLKCFVDIIAKSTDEKISLKAAFAISPKYLFMRNNKNVFSKIRIISDACFR